MKPLSSNQKAAAIIFVGVAIVFGLILLCGVALMWIEFLRDVDVRVTRCMTRAYKRGTVAVVHEKHAAQILAAGAGRQVEGPCL